MSPTDRVRDAIARTPKDYLDSTIAMRAGKSGKAMGSTYPLTSAELKARLLAAEWRPYSHPDIAPPAVGFESGDLGVGQFGMIAASALPQGAEVVLVDPKHTGYVEGVTFLRQAWNKQPGVRALLRTDRTTILLGPGDDGAEVVWTFFPGEPVKPSRIRAQGREGQKLPAWEAHELGLDWVKIEV